MTQLTVSVAQAVAAGQQVVFTTPDGQRMQVTAAEPLEAGSTLLVQYEGVAAPIQPMLAETVVVPQAHVCEPLATTILTNGVIVRPMATGGSGPSVGPLLPEVSASMDTADKSASNTAWGLYVAGWAALCFGCVICAPIFWTCSCCRYFWKDSRTRAQFPRQRRPALIALWTCLFMMVLAIMGGVCSVVHVHGFHRRNLCRHRLLHNLCQHRFHHHQTHADDYHASDAENRYDYNHDDYEEEDRAGAWADDTYRRDYDYEQKDLNVNPMEKLGASDLDLAESSIENTVALKAMGQKTAEKVGASGRKERSMVMKARKTLKNTMERTGASDRKDALKAIKAKTMEAAGASDVKETPVEIALKVETARTNGIQLDVSDRKIIDAVVV